MAEHPMFEDDLREIVDSFVIETKEIYERLDSDLLRIEKNPHDKELINTIFRAVHTVKGTSGFIGHDQMSELTHHFEDVLNKLRRDEIEFHTGMMDVMLDAFDLMRALLQQVIDEELETLELTEVIGRLDNISKTAGDQEAEPSQAELEALFDAPAKTEETATPVETPEVVAETKPEAVIPTAKATPKKAVAKKAAPKKAKASQVEATIRVDVNRLDHLMNLVGELVLGRNRLAQIISNINTRETDLEEVRELMDTNTQIDFITSELQSAVMKTRMVQVGRVFNKFPRVVRDIAREFGKKIDLEIVGEETEMDKSIVEEIGDPLVHLIRNAADHGVEGPEARIKAGKSPNGKVKLSAGHEGNHIIIEIQDDGAGMDPEMLRKKAIEKNVITEDEAADMSDAEAFNLIFKPGFSTAQKVSSISGRGVGMDVVKTNITKLNGTISIDSELGKGSRFTLKLPLTLAIIQGLLVKVSNETFAVPLHSVIEVVRIEREDVHSIQGREVIRLRERVLPLMHVSEVLDLDGDDTRNADSFYVVVLGVAHKQFGMVVESMLGQKEIVIKSLGTYLKNVPGIAGSTIMGDGRVIMILDIGEMAKMLRHTKQQVIEEAGI